MCRLFGFRSSIQSGVHQSLVQAENALARLSQKHTDGWGISFYVDNYPHVIRNDKRASGDSLFRELSGVVSTRTLLAHIRLATVGRLSVLNCHPFQHGRWTFAHNGEIAGFEKREVQERVCDLVDSRYRGYILGDTDSEVLFHVFLSQLSRRAERINGVGIEFDAVLGALRATVQLILEAAPNAAVSAERQNKLTVLLTNGDILLGYRWGKELNYSTYKSQCVERQSCAAFEESLCEKEVGDGHEVKHLVVASEALGDGTQVWAELDEDEFVAVRYGMVLRKGYLSTVEGSDNAAGSSGGRGQDAL